MKIALIPFTQDFWIDYGNQPDSRQAMIDFCLEQILASPAFPPESLECKPLNDGKYEFRVACEEAEIWISAHSPGPGILQLTGISSEEAP